MSRTLIATSIDFLVNMAASADVLAQAKVEISLGAIPEGKNVCSARSAPIPGLCLTHVTGHYQMARQARLHPPPHRI
jgi:hypothetical protein